MTLSAVISATVTEDSARPSRMTAGGGVWGVMSTLRD